MSEETTPRALRAWKSPFPGVPVLGWHGKVAAVGDDLESVLCELHARACALGEAVNAVLVLETDHDLDTGRWTERCDAVEIGG